MNRVEQAVKNFHNPYSCSQTIFTAFGPGLGCPEDMCVRVASCFGGGMARTGNTCGLVTGALMAIGLMYNPDSSSPKDEVYQLARTFKQNFEANHGSITCRDLLGHDISTPEGQQKVETGDLHEKICRELVKSAAEILDGILPQASE
ncbi:MAG: C-GCAxxG-C-C family protein [Methylocystaceae bacterium]